MPNKTWEAAIAEVSQALRKIIAVIVSDPELEAVLSEQPLEISQLSEGMMGIILIGKDVHKKRKRQSFFKKLRKSHKAITSLKPEALDDGQTNFIGDHE